MLLTVLDFRSLNLLVTSNGAISAFLDIIPATDPWLSGYSTSLWRSITVEAIHNFLMNCTKHLNIYHKNQSSITQQEFGLKEKKMIILKNLTGFVFTGSGGGSCPLSHFHKSGFS